MAGQWAWHCYDMATNASLGTVAMSSWYHEDRLNDPGSWNAELLPVETAAEERFALAATAPARSVVLARRIDDEGITRIEFSGWVPPGGRHRPQVSGAGLLSYLDRRVISDPAGLAYTNTDQASILAGLVNAAPTARIDTGTVAPSMVLRTASWTQSDGKPIGEAIRDIASRINGLDFDIRTELAGGVPTRRLRTWYPRRGFDGTVPVFTYPGNMLTAPVEEGNPDFATEVIALGTETNATNHDRLRVVRRNQALLDLGYPLITIKLDRFDVTTVQGLTDLADGALLEAATQTENEVSFQVDPTDSGWPWGKWDLGADCMVQAEAGRVAWRPDGLAEMRRIVAHRWTKNAKGEALTVVTRRPWQGSL